MNRDDNHRELRRSMHGKIAIMPYDTFMNTFVPDPRVPEKRFRNCRTEVFKDMKTPDNEVEMYREIPKRLNQKERPCRGFVVVSTPHKSDSASSSKIAPDCGIYPREHAPQVDDATQYGRTDWSHLEITIECKPSFAQDPFDDNTANSEPLAKARKSALGQILSYAEHVFHTQHRQHHFMIVFLGTSARLVRIDRGCVFATQRFNYVEHEQCLTEFLWRYARLSPAQRGFDPTAQRLNPKNTRDPLVRLMREKLKVTKEKSLAEPHILDAYEASLDDNVPWWKLEVCHEVADVPRFFVVGKPHFLAPGVRGRGTRGYIALPVLDNGTLGDFVYLKDAWRVKHEEIMQEGTTLEFLNQKKVPHIPTLVCHGDLPDQLTSSRTTWMELNPEQDYCPIKVHQHYRMVVEEIGKPLSQFKNSRELIRALCSVLEAHEAAYLHGIIHRDISAGNILLYKDKKGRWQGLLTDWELAKDIHNTSRDRQPERTGTWQFMSAHVQNDSGRVVVIADELESVFHVLIFYTVRFCHHTIPKGNVGHFLYQYFDGHAAFSHGTRSGLPKRNAMEQGAINLETYTGVKESLRFIWPSTTAHPNQGLDLNHPLNEIVTTLLSWFQAHYALDDLVESGAQAPPMDHRTDGNVDLGDDEDDSSDSDDSSDDDDDDDTGPLLDSQKIKKRAAKLATHRAMRRLLKKAIQKGRAWPAEDEKTNDQRSKEGFVRDCDPESDDLSLGIINCEDSQEDSQEPLQASQDSSVPASDEEVQWEEPEEDVEEEEEEDPDTEMEMQEIGMQEEESQTEGTLVEDELEDPFADGFGLHTDAVPRSWTPPSPSYILSSTTSTSSRKRYRDEPDEPTTPTKRSRTDD